MGSEVNFKRITEIEFGRFALGEVKGTGGVHKTLRHGGEQAVGRGFTEEPGPEGVTEQESEREGVGKDKKEEERTDQGRASSLAREEEEAGGDDEEE